MMIVKGVSFLLALFGVVLFIDARAQAGDIRWIQPTDGHAEAVWGIENGVVFSLCPYSVEHSEQRPFGGGPRGLNRVGYQYGGKTYMMNFLAIKPVVDGEIEFSEVSPSVIDGVWGKLLWASDRAEPGYYYPTARTRGVITQMGEGEQLVEELSVYIFMERFAHGAAPYLRLSIRSDRPEELGVQVFHLEGSAPMDRCAITATMGNYSRLRNLHLK